MTVHGSWFFIQYTIRFSYGRNKLPKKLYRDNCDPGPLINNTPWQDTYHPTKRRRTVDGWSTVIGEGARVGTVGFHRGLWRFTGGSLVLVGFKFWGQLDRTRLLEASSLSEVKLSPLLLWVFPMKWVTM